MKIEEIVSEIRSFIVCFLTGFLLFGNYLFIKGSVGVEYFVAVCLFVIASCNLMNTKR